MDETYSQEFGPSFLWMKTVIGNLVSTFMGAKHFGNLVQIPWPTPHAADPSLCSMSFLGTSWHDLISIGQLVCH